MRILFLQKRLLFPADTGGKIRTLNVVRHLAADHEVTYLCNARTQDQPYLSQMRQLGVDLETFPWQEPPRNSVRFYAGLLKSLVSKYPFTVNKDFDRRIHQRARSLISTKPFDLLICDFVQMSRNVMGVHGVPKLLFQHNVEAQVYRRMADNERNALKRAFIRNQQRKMEAFEARVGREFQRVIAVSKTDRQTFQNQYGWDHVDVIDTAVDTTYFAPNPSVERKQGRIVFVGSMDWIPNQEGITRFVTEVLPRIQEQIGNASLDIVGRNPPSSIRRLARHHNVHVTGSVDDVRPYIAAAELAVVPIYAGGGTRLKIFEFMAIGTPVVSTTVGAEGLDIEPGVHWMCADSDDAFADTVSQLLNEPEQRAHLSDAARRHVVDRYRSEVVAQQFERICVGVVERWASSLPQPDSSTGVIGR